MRESEYARPDAAVMERLLEQHRCDPTGIVLRLAWKAGLMRNEIHALTWDRVDFDEKLLRLPDREVPLDAETAEVLALWKNRCAGFTEYVAASCRRKTHLSPVSLSQLAGSALGGAGMEDVTLKDLRSDYILRQWETHDWPYVLRVSGISLAAYRSYFAPMLKRAGRAAPVPPPESAPPEAETGTDEFRLWQLMQKNRRTPAGIAIWLIQQMGLQLNDIVALTWDDVDFKAGVIRARSGAAPLARGAARILREERARRAPEDDPHVILSAKARKPVTTDRLSVLIREAMIQGGVTDATALDLRLGLLRDMDWRLLRDRVEARGSIGPREAGEVLGISESAAWQRLQALEKRGYLVHVGHYYYSAERTPPAERLKDTIYGYIGEHGSIGAGEASALLNVPVRRVGYLLRTMAKNGELGLTEKPGRYVLPAGAEAAGA